MRSTIGWPHFEAVPVLLLIATDLHKAPGTHRGPHSKWWTVVSSSCCCTILPIAIEIGAIDRGSPGSRGRYCAYVAVGSVDPGSFHWGCHRHFFKFYFGTQFKPKLSILKVNLLTNNNYFILNKLWNNILKFYQLR